MRTLLRLVSCLVFLAAVTPLSSLAGWSGLDADQMVSYDDNEYARAVQIHIPGFGDVIQLFWGEDAPTVREIHYGRSIDTGETWSCSGSDRVISFPDGNDVWPEECDVASRSWVEPLTIVVWSEDDTATREVHYGVSNDMGESWSSETADHILSDPTTAADTSVPSIACDNDGVFHVVWHQATAGGGPAEVHYSRSTDAGATWSGQTADRAISFPDGNPAINPSIACDGQGYLYVVWRENDDSGMPAIHAGVSTDGGASWSSETADDPITGPASIITDLAIATEICADNEAYVVYRASFDTQSPYHYEIYSTSTGNGGATWDGETELIPVSHDEGAGRSASNPDVFYGWGQGVIAVWNEEDDLSGTQEQHVSRLSWGWTGATEDEIISFPDGENGYRPSITGVQCLISAELPRHRYYDTFVAWTEFAGDATDNYEVHFSAEAFISSDAPDSDDLLGGLTLRAFPNPADGATRIEWSGAVTGSGNLEIFDAAGRSLYERPIASGTSVGAIRWEGIDRAGRTLPAGFYFARVRSAGESRTVTIVRY